MSGIRVVLMSTYELGHQPFGLASPAAWLQQAGAAVTCLDLAVQRLDEDAVAAADLVALYVPMHTATRLAAALVARLRQINPTAHLCFYGLYAPVNEVYLRGLGADTILGGEFEQGLLSLVQRLRAERDTAGQMAQAAMPTTQVAPSAQAPTPAAQAVEQVAHDGPVAQPEPIISLARQQFVVPERSGLPPLTRYAYVRLPNGERRTAGYTEATRGCKHLCRHCPIPPVYAGTLRVVQHDVVLADVARQVAAGAQHITFGDPDFFNGPGHALRIVRALYEQFPTVSYDVTIKVEHLLKHTALLPVLRETGCLFITSAVEAVDDRILAIFEKRHTRADFLRVVALLREDGIALNPTFVPFTPWTTLHGYHDLLALVARLGLVENVAPIQYGIRLLIPAGSRLLDLPMVQEFVGAFDQAALCYPWSHPDPRVDRLCASVLDAVQAGQSQGASRRAIFDKVWHLACDALDEEGEREEGGLVASVSAGKRRSGTPLPRAGRSSAPIPHLSEAWYC